jgi:hypothetical protein
MSIINYSLIILINDLSFKIICYICKYNKIAVYETNDLNVIIFYHRFGRLRSNWMETGVYGRRVHPREKSYLCLLQQTWKCSSNLLY